MTVTTQHSSIELLETALQSRGYRFEKLELDDTAYTRFISPTGKSWLTQDARIGYPVTTASVRKISSEKYLAHEFAQSLGVSSPATTKVIGKLPEADMRALLQTSPVVVKPSNSSLSNGVTLQIRTLPALETALAVAHAFSDVALVQSQVEGDEIRFVVIDGKVRAAILRQTPRVVGDGQHTIAELLVAENKARSALTMPYLQYPQLDDSLINTAELDLDKVLARGEVVELNRATMIRDGASVYNVYDEVHDSYKATAEKLVDALGAHFIVVDMILHDFRAPQTDTNYSFIEFNTGPVLKLFYSCRDGKHYDILTDIVPMLDATISGGNHE